MNTKIKLNKRKLQLLGSAIRNWQNSGQYLSMKYSGECNDLCLRLWGMHVCAPWGKEAKVKFQSAEIEALEYALTYELNRTCPRTKREELHDLHALFGKTNLLLHIAQ